MLRKLEFYFEKILWSGRFVVVIAVIASMAAAIAMFYMATVDVFYLVSHMLNYADFSLTAAARKIIHDETITHVVEVVDGYLLATFMLIFSLGMYELFVSDIDEAHSNKTSSRILVIDSLDDLKARLAKVILMILIVTVFEEAISLDLKSPLDLLYVSGAIALVGLALYLSHKSDHTENKTDSSNQI